MTMSTTWAGCLDAVDTAAHTAGLDADQTRSLRNSAASWAMDGRYLTPEELRVGAEIMTGRITFDEARHSLGL